MARAFTYYNMKVPKKQKHFNFGSKRGNSLLTQLRVGRSFLNSHGYTINLTESDLCLCSRPETVSHFLNHCFLYQEERKVLYDKVTKLLPKFNTFSDKIKTDYLLHGINLHSSEPDSRNVPLTLAVQNYILQTGRFLFLTSDYLFLFLNTLIFLFLIHLYF